MTCCSMKKLLGSKRGDVQGAVVIMVLLFSLAVISVISYFIYSNFITAFSSTPFYTSEVAEAATYFGNVLRMFDVVLLLTLFVVIAAQAYLNYKLAVEPAGFIGTFFLSGIVGLVGLFFAYAYSALVGEAALVSTSAFFPKTLIILSNLHWVGFVSMIIGSLTLYAKRRQGQFE